MLTSATFYRSKGLLLLLYHHYIHQSHHFFLLLLLLLLHLLIVIILFYVSMDNTFLKAFIFNFLPASLLLLMCYKMLSS